MRISRFVAGAASAAMIAALVAAAPAGASSHVTKAKAAFTIGHKFALHKVGRVNVTTLAREAAAHPATTNRALGSRWARMQAQVAAIEARVHPGSAVRSPSISAPSPKLWSVSGATTAGFKGFSGVNANVSRNLNGFDVEPPDQGLCMGAGNVIDIVNLAMQAYSTSGKAKGGPISMNAFFGQDPTAFTSDPKCMYDPQTQRFYATSLETDVATFSEVLLAVSETSNPMGFWDIFYIDTTDGSGSTPGHPGCPCLGDQPLLGFDANGIYISTNEFGLAAPTFNGTQIYQVSKAYLLHGYLLVGFQYEPYCDGTTSDPWCSLNDPTSGSTFGTLGGNNQIYSQQPITSAGGSSWKIQGGTMFFMGTADYNGVGGDIGAGVVVIAITGDAQLGGTFAQGNMSGAYVHTAVYGFPPLANQKSGPTPYADYLNTLASTAPDASPFCGTAQLLPACVEGQIETNDDRMNQTFLAKGSIWGSWNTVVHNKGMANRSGLKWAAVHPSFTSACTTTTGDFTAPCVTGTLKHQGIIATKASLYYPSMVVAPNGHVFVTASMSGSAYYPSAVYATDVPMSGTGTVNVFGAGKDPQDGFTEYDYPPGRWGDYSAAEMTPGGRVWFASEWIPGLVNVLGGGAANWGTKVGTLMP